MSMYKTPELMDKVILGDIQIPNQDKIIKETGTPLDLYQAYEIIRQVSNDFQRYDEKAIEADALLSKLMERELKRKKIGKDLEDAGKEKPNRRIEKSEEVKQEKAIVEEAKQEKEEKASASRKRKLQLIKLKMQLEKEKK